MLKVSEHKDNCAKNMYPKYTIFPFYKLYTESATTTGKRKTVNKCIKTKNEQDCLGTGVIRVFTDQDYI